MRLIVFLFLNFFVLCSVMAQSDEAQEALSKKDWKTAIRLFTQNIEKDPHDFGSYAYLMTALNGDRRYNDAMQISGKALAIADHLSGVNYIRYQMSRASAGLNRKSDALLYLKLAADNASIFPLRDSLFASIKDDPQFLAIAQEMKQNNRPCAFDPRYQKFNFFIGVWDVYTGDHYENKVALDSVTLSSSGCSVQENFIWLGGGFRGVSMTYFDPGTQHYKMCWTGSNADIRTFDETRSTKDTIELLAVTNTGNNELVHRKMLIAIEPSGKTIHQFIQNSFDQGRTWVTDWDARFVKRD